MRHPSLVPLSHDHHHGLALALKCRKQALGQIKPMGAEGLRERAKEFRDFFEANLIQHFRAEEEVLFPLLCSLVPESQTMIEELTKDHERIRSAKVQLGSDTGLGKLIFDLGDLLERHIRREERELFPLFESHIGAAEAAAIGEKIKKILAAPTA
jgi:iron-sulfur cluster repair protein YtfE (RIC family)